MGTDYLNFNQPGNGTLDLYAAIPYVPPINIFAPVYSFSGNLRPAPNGFGPFTELWKGVYAQDMISFADDRLHLLIGGRYDWADTFSGFSSISYADALANSVSALDKHFSPRVGAVVQRLPWLSFTVLM
ncbi:TonB-dependent receptor [Methylocapsa sp. D3K7]|nr:TonB-dependent receptor [Methylocapsa sp. D3K7]WGJ16488.1 TonB-dependent receptor [Methylocapsa sp. D3K7]